MTRGSLAKALPLKQFLLRLEVIKLYRKCFRAVNGISDPYYRDYMKHMVRDEFRLHKGEVDDREIRVLVNQGQKKLNDLTSTMRLATGKSS